MKRIFSLAFAFSFSILLTACASGSNDAGTSGIDLSKEMAEVEKRGVGREVSGGNTCLLGYQHKYDALLTQQMVIDATGYNPDVLKVKYNKVLSADKHEINYLFKNGRRGKVPGIKTEQIVPDLISLRMIAPMSLQTFERRHRAVTDEERAAAKEVLNVEAEGQPGAADLRKKGGGLLEGFAAISKAWTVVDGTGDAARWNTITNELAVLSDGVCFTIVANASNNKNSNRELAIKLAAGVLGKCNE